MMVPSARATNGSTLASAFDPLQLPGRRLDQVVAERDRSGERDETFTGAPDPDVRNDSRVAASAIAIDVGSCVIRDGTPTM
jgi:hypothetical protein